MRPMCHDTFLLQGAIQLDVLTGVSRQRHRRETSDRLITGDKRSVEACRCVQFMKQCRLA
jgi:hypothetical protein